MKNLSQTPNPNKLPTILVIDDDEGIVEMTTELLTSSGYKVIPLTNVKDSKEVEDVIINNYPVIILLDLWMPGIRGETLTKELKSNNQTKNTPIIIIAAHRQTEEIAQNVGADDFLVKPYNITDLEAVVTKYCNLLSS